MGISDIINEIDKKFEDDGGLHYIGLKETFTELSEIFRILTGLLITLIVIGIIFVIALEVAYINFPVLQTRFRQLSEKSKRMKKIMGICLRDANRAIEIADTINTGKSINIVYASIKWKGIFITFIILGLIINIKYILVLIDKLSIPFVEIFNRL